MMDWIDSYSVGNQRIDFQHRIFLDLLNEFSRSGSDGSPLERQCRIAQEVIKYAEYHFLSEENLMRDHDYAGLERHRILHNYLLSKVKVKAHELELGICTADQLLQFLGEWFVLHVIHEDKEMSRSLLQP